MTLNLEGQTFGCLTALRRVFPNSTSGSSRWLFQCSCGKLKELVGSEVVRGKTISCGHIRDEMRRTCQLGKIGPLSGKWSGYKGISGHFWRALENNAKSRNLSIEFTIEQLYHVFELQKGKCALTGVSLVFNRRTTDSTGTASVDRIDSSRHYTLDNIQWVHKDINRMKQYFSQEQFIEWCRLVSVHNEH